MDCEFWHKVGSLSLLLISSVITVKAVVEGNLFWFWLAIAGWVGFGFLAWQPPRRPGGPGAAAP